MAIYLHCVIEIRTALAVGRTNAGEYWIELKDADVAGLSPGDLEVIAQHGYVPVGLSLSELKREPPTVLPRPEPTVKVALEALRTRMAEERVKQGA